jgi:hypothetical protein
LSVATVYRNLEAWICGVWVRFVGSAYGPQAFCSARFFSRVLAILGERLILAMNFSSRQFIVALARFIG